MFLVLFQADGERKKSRVTKKYVIAGVTIVTVIALLIAGILVGVKFFLDSTNDIVTVLVMRCFKLSPFFLLALLTL